SDDAVPFVAERLAADDRDLARAAAVALGDAHQPEASVALRERLPGESRADVRHAIITALATSRRDEAFDALLELVARGTEAAAEALELYRGDEALMRRLQAARDGRKAPVAPRARRPRRSEG